MGTDAKDIFLSASYVTGIDSPENKAFLSAMSAPTRDAEPESFAAFRSACVKLLCLSGLSGCTQLAFPITDCAGNISLSLLGARSTDRMLVYVARQIRAE